MLRAAIAFFVLGLIAMLLGASGFAGMSMDIGKTLLVVFLILAVVSFIANLVSGRRSTLPSVFFMVGLAGAAASMGLVGCASANKAADQVAAAPSQETQNAATASGASQAAEVTFGKNSAVVPEGSRQAIADMVRAATANGGKIDEIRVVAWADREVPANAKELPKADRDLAKKRAEAIAGYLKNDLQIGDVSTHNMAERPNALQNLFNTEDKKVKDAMANSGVSMNGSQDGITGKASRAVVMIIMES